MGSLGGLGAVQSGMPNSRVRGRWARTTWLGRFGPFTPASRLAGSLVIVVRFQQISAFLTAPVLSVKVKLCRKGGLQLVNDPPVGPQPVPSPLKPLTWAKRVPRVGGQVEGSRGKRITLAGSRPAEHSQNVRAVLLGQTPPLTRW